ncbi:VCBS domain-containing protein [Undibacterium arcticum]
MPATATAFSLVGTPAAHGTAGVDAATGNWTYTVTDAGAVDALAVGEHLADSFTVQVSDGHGGLVTQSVTIDITGTNDAPVITSAAQAGNVSEGDALAASAMTAAGQVTVSDVDTSDSHSFSLVGTPAAHGTAGVDAATGNWTYTVTDAGAVDALAVGEHLADSFTVQVSDGHGGLVTQSVTIDITGTNDAPVITSAAQAGNVSEGDALAASAMTAAGQVTVSDVDTSDSHSFSLVGTPAAHGTAGVDAATGNWTYTVTDAGAVDALAVGEHLADSFTVQVSDGHGGLVTQSVTIDITGTNDAAVISGTSSGSVVEAGGVANGTPGMPTATGTLTDTDVDNTPNTFQAGSAGTASTDGYGTYAVTSGGVWTYTLNNNNSSVQALNSGGTLTDHITVKTADGTTQVVTVTINGANDAAVISGTSSGSVVEAGGVANGTPGTPTATGTLTDTDVDNTSNTFQAVSAGTASTDGYGTYAMTAGGTWTYTLDNSNGTVQALNSGGTLTDHITVKTADGTTQVVTVTINGSNDAPVITSGASASTPENVSTSTAVYTVTATDVDIPTTLTYSLTGIDAALFNINSSTGAVKFNTSPNFEAPADNGGNNVYDIIVHATDGIADTTKAVAITVTNVIETPTTTVSNIHISADSGTSSTDFITNVAAQSITATLSAPLAAGESVLGSVDGGASWVTVGTVSGTSITWSATLSGSSSIEFKVANTDGQSGPTASQSYVLDTTASSAATISSVTDDVSPVTGTLTSGASTNDTDLTVKVSLTGTSAVAGDTVQLYNGTGTGSQLGTSYTLTSTDISNTFANVQTGTLTNGTTYAITARVTDAAGNQSVVSTNTFTVTEDTTAPNAPSITTVTDDVAPVTGTLTSGASSNDTDLTVKVTLPTTGSLAVAGDTVQLFNGAGTLGSAHVLTGAEITAGFVNLQTGTLTNGTTYNMTAKITDAAGNISGASNTFTVTEDTTAPSAATISSVTDDVSPVTGTLTSGASTNDTDLTVKVSLTGTSAVAGDTVQLYNGTGTGSQLGTSYTLTSTDISNTFANVQSGTLTNGTTYAITARVTDAAGNQSVVSTNTFTVTEDTTAPNAPSITTVTDDMAPVTGTLTSGASSNDTDLTVKVTLPTTGSLAVAGDTVQLFNGAGTLGSAHVLTGAEITAGFVNLQTGTLTNGTTYNMTAKITDAAGNISGASNTFTVTEDTTAPSAATISSVTDDVSPVTGTLTSGASTNDTDLTVKVSLTGTSAVAGDTVQLYNGTGTGSQLGTSYTLTSTDISNTFANVQTGTLTNGTTYAITARVTDAAGNQSVVSTNTFTVTEDTTAPNAPSITTVTDDVAPVTGTLTSGASSNDTDLTVKVTLPTTGSLAVAGDTVQLFNGAGTLGSAHVLTGAEITAGFVNLQTGTLTNGTTYNMTAKITDAAGNISGASNTFTVTEDTTAPSAATISSVTDDVSPVTGTLTSGASTNDTDLTVKVSLTGTSAVAGDTVQLYNGTGTGSQLGTSYTLTSTDISNTFANVQSGTLTNGTTYAITARVTDAAGNQSVVSTNTFTVTEDTTAPNAPSITTVTDDVAPVTGTLTSGASSNDTDLTVKVTLPTTGSLAVAGDTVQLFNGAGTLGSAHVLTGAEITAGFVNLQTGTLTNGTTYNMTAKITDAAGNISGASNTFTVTEDTTAPSAATISSVTDDVSPVTGTLTSGASTNDTDLTVKVSLTGTSAVAGDTVQLYNGTGTGSQLGTSYTLTSTDISNTFANVQTGTLTNGTTYAITARVTDAAGNQSVVSTNTFTVTEDTTAPNAPSITTVTDDVAPVTGTLTSGASSNDTDLTVKVTLPTTGSLAVAGDTVQLFNGAGTLGSAHVLTGAEITAGLVNLQTGTLTNGTTYNMTAKITDAAGNISGASNTFTVTEDTTAPSAATISSVTDDVSPVTGTLTSGASTNDTDLTVKVSLTGTSAVAGDTVQLYNGTGTGSQLGTSYTLTSTDISNTFANVQTGTLTNGTTYAITARVTDAAGNQSVVSTNTFTVTEDTTAPNAPSITTVTDDVAPVTGTLTSGASSNDTDLTVKVTLPTTGSLAVAGDTVQLFNGAGTLGSAHVLTGAEITAGLVNLQAGTLTNGTTYNMTAKITDAAGNVSGASNTFTVTEDTTAPAAPTSLSYSSLDSGGRTRSPVGLAALKVARLSR